MGDTGSLLCGFIISVLAIQFIEMRAVPSTPAVAVGILFVPLFDTMRVFIIRIFKGISPFTPDKNHIHHRIMGMGFPQISTVVILAFINMLVTLFVVKFAELGNPYIMGILFIFSLVLSLFLGVYRAKTVQEIS
jgi:UDP-N-acetylmuramyl pentapeptide phosphotransferase/UDP-N-acetylglucosamine-1-phosphate transferase